MRFATIATFAALAGCARGAVRPAEKPVASTPAAASTTPATPPPSVAGSGHACPAPLTTPFAVVPQGGMGAAAEFQFSKDGRTAAAKPSPLEIQIWNVTSGNKIAIIAPGTPISQWALRPDGRMVAIVSNGHVSLVDPASRAAPIKVTLPANVERLDWKSDGKTLFVTRAQETSLVDAAGAVTATIAAVSPPGGISADGRFLFSREGAMWDIATNQSKWKAAAPSSSVAFSDDGQALALGASQSITVLDSSSGNKKWEATTKGAINSEIALSPDGQSVAAYDNGDYSERGLENRGMGLWTRGKRIRLWGAAEAGASLRPAFSPDGKVVGYVASGNMGPEIRLADARTGARAKQAKSMSDIRSEPVRWSADGRTMLQPGTNGLIVIDMTKGDRRIIGKSATESVVAANSYRDAVWSPDDGALLIIVDQGPRSIATIVDLKTGTTRETLDMKAATPIPRRFRAAEWNAASGIIAIDRSDGIALWDGRSKQPLRMIDTGDGDLAEHQFALSPQGNLLATLAAPHKEVKLWDPKTGARVRSLTVAGVAGTTNEDGMANLSVVENMAFSADGTKIALSAAVVGGVEQSTHIAIFDAATGALVRTLHTKRLYAYGYGYGRSGSGAIHFTAQGKGIVAVASSGHVDLWNTATDDPPMPLLEKAAPGPSTLADSGNLLLMGSTTLDVWDLRTATRTRELGGDGAPVMSAKMAKGVPAVAVTRIDRVDIHRLSDRASLTLRLAPGATTPSFIISSDNGAFTGPAGTAAAATSALRVRDGAEPDVRALRPNEATTLYRPSLALDFVAGCPMSAP